MSSDSNNLTSRELVKATLEFRNTSGRVPRQQWTLPWASNTYPEIVTKIESDFPPDIVTAYVLCGPSPIAQGDPHEIGESIDSWGCKFVNMQRGIIGEVQSPLVKEEEWEDYSNVHIPEEALTFDIAEVNKFCAGTDKFVLSAACPRPFEQLQFIRTTELLYMDLVYPPEKMMAFIEKMHDYYCRLLTKWAKTDVDGLSMMDDWGSQNALLINPKTWREIFKPMYRDYINIAHSHGKKIFMHSDGNILAIYPDLIELGLDAVNSQIFCMGIDNLKPFKGQITFWGEIDRQNIIPYGTLDDIDNAVTEVYEKLWDNGGCIAQSEFSIGANPDNVYRIYEKWQTLNH